MARASCAPNIFKILNEIVSVIFLSFISVKDKSYLNFIISGAPLSRSWLLFVSGEGFSFWLQAKLNIQIRWKKKLAVYKYCVNKYDIAIFNQIFFKRFLSLVI